MNKFVIIQSNPPKLQKAKGITCALKYELIKFFLLIFPIKNFLMYKEKEQSITQISSVIILKILKSGLSSPGEITPSENINIIPTAIAIARSLILLDTITKSTFKTRLLFSSINYFLKNINHCNSIKLTLFLIKIIIKARLIIYEKKKKH